MTKLASLSLLVFASGACTSFDPNLGNSPFLCGEGDICPDGYGCQDQAGKKICVVTGGAVPDAGPSGFQCADDSALGQNDMISGAFAIPSQPTFTLAGLAICPETDRDTYAINLTTPNKGIKIESSWDSGPPVNISILNQGGTSIGNGTSSGEKSLKACAPNLPTGMYFGQAFSMMAMKNNYRLKFDIVDNCN